MRVDNTARNINDTGYKTRKIKNDKLLNISTAASKSATIWKNERILWSELITIFNHPTTTNETMGDYKRMGKSEQDKIKDVGGFVGGQLRGGRRKAENVISRDVIALDVDYAEKFPGLWESYSMVYGNAAYLYPTHSSIPEKPRYRLIIPLSRSVSPDEYEAIGRKIAQSLFIDAFDDTTYQPSRLMFWPSIPSDAVYDSQFLDGSFLDPDDVLSEYIDWTDVTEWPYSERAKKDFKSTLKRQQDPLIKNGVIGAFCRAYTVQEAIEAFLGYIYEPCDTGNGNRYTYIEGSTSGGLVCYDDKFCYSNHATDPASNRLCNAFDIVRVHKFETKIKEEDPEKSDSEIKNESLQLMSVFASNDERVKRQNDADRFEAAKNEFEPIEDKEHWADQLEYNKRMELIVSKRNLRLIAENDPEICGAMVYDVFSDKVILKSLPPWRKQWADKTQAYCDQDAYGFAEYVEKRYGTARDVSTNASHEALAQFFKQVEFHPVKEYLESLPVWDKEKRLETLFIDFLGAKDDAYTRAVTRAELIGGVKRIYEPGCKLDEFIVLVGPQGIGKSTIIYMIANGWFTDDLPVFSNKEAIEQLPGHWIVELSELSALRKSDNETLKSFISRREDKARPAYGRVRIDRKRSCIFFGTTNNHEFLNDPTGARRFWPIDVTGKGSKDLWKDLTADYIGMIWAEALQAYREGEKTILIDPEVRALAKEAQKKHTEEDVLYGQIIAFLEMPVPKKWLAMSLSDRRDYISEYRSGVIINRDECFDIGNQKKEELCKIDRVCVLSIFHEMMGEPEGKAINPQLRKQINSSLRKLKEEGWATTSYKNFGASIGYQRGYVRTE